MLRLLLCFIASISIGVLTYGGLEKFSSASFVAVMGVLLNVSAIIFAIIGAWIAIIYPKALQSPLSNGQDAKVDQLIDTVQDANYLSELFEIVLQSAAVIVMAVAIQVVMPLFKAYQYFDIDLALIKCVAVSTMVFLAMIQLNAILTVVKKNYGLLLRVRRKHAEAVEKNDLGI